MLKDFGDVLNQIVDREGLQPQLNLVGVNLAEIDDVVDQ